MRFRVKDYCRIILYLPSEDKLKASYAPQKPKRIEDDVDMRLSEDESPLEAEDAHTPSPAHRPPSYNPEDYAHALAKYSRAQNLYVHDHKDKKGRGKDKEKPSGKEEMSLKQFASLPELLRRLREDLKTAYISFVKELVRDPHDGVSLLLDLLKMIQLAQSNLSGSATNREQQIALRRTLVDEFECLSCLRSCLRSGDASPRLATYRSGLYALAAATMSSLTRSRTVALQLLTKACEHSVCGHRQVIEAFSTLRLRFAEPVRCKFLVSMMLSYPHPSFQVWGLKLVNAMLCSAVSLKERIYLQEELGEAGFDSAAIKKALEHRGAATPEQQEAVRAELSKWNEGYIDLTSLEEQLTSLKTANMTLQQELQHIRQANMKLLEENVLVKAVGGEVEERCFALKRRLEKHGIPSAPSPTPSVTDSEVSSFANTGRSTVRRNNLESPGGTIGTNGGPEGERSMSLEWKAIRPPPEGKGPPSRGLSREGSSRDNRKGVAPPVPKKRQILTSTDLGVNSSSVYVNDLCGGTSGYRNPLEHEIQRSEQPHHLQQQQHIQQQHQQLQQQQHHQLQQQQHQQLHHQQQHQVQPPPRTSSREQQCHPSPPQPPKDPPSSQADSRASSRLSGAALASGSSSSGMSSPKSILNGEYEVPPAGNASKTEEEEEEEEHIYQSPVKPSRPKSRKKSSSSKSSSTGSSQSSGRREETEKREAGGAGGAGNSSSVPSLSSSTSSLSVTSSTASLSGAERKDFGDHEYENLPKKEPTEKSNSNSNRSAKSDNNSNSRNSVSNRSSNSNSRNESNNCTNKPRGGVCDEGEIEYERDVVVYEAITLGNDTILLDKSNTNGSDSSNKSHKSAKSDNNNIKTNERPNVRKSVRHYENLVNKVEKREEMHNGASEKEKETEKGEGSKGIFNGLIKGLKSNKKKEKEAKEKEAKKAKTKKEAKDTSKRTDDVSEREVEAVMNGFENILRSAESSLNQGAPGAVKENPLLLKDQPQFEDRSSPAEHQEGANDIEIVPTRLPQIPPRSRSRGTSSQGSRSRTSDPVVYLESPSETSDTDTFRNTSNGPPSPVTMDTTSTRSFGWVRGSDVGIRRRDTFADKSPDKNAAQRQRHRLRRSESVHASHISEYNSHRSFSPRRRGSAELLQVPLEENEVQISGRRYMQYTAPEVEHQNRVNNLLSSEVKRRRNRSCDDRLDHWLDEDFLRQQKYEQEFLEDVSRRSKRNNYPRGHHDPDGGGRPKCSRSSKCPQDMRTPNGCSPSKSSRSSKPRYSPNDMTAFNGFVNPTTGLRESDYGPNFMLNSPSNPHLLEEVLTDLVEFGNGGGGGGEGGGGGGMSRSDLRFARKMLHHGADPAIPTPDYSATPAGTLTNELSPKGRHILDMASGLY